METEKIDRTVALSFLEAANKIERYVFLGAPGKPEEINAIQESFRSWNSEPLKNVCFKDQHFTNLAGVYPGYSNSQDVINKELIDESHYAIFVFRDTLGSKDEESQQFRTVSEWERAYHLCLERKMINAIPFFFKESNDDSVNNFKKKFEDGEYKVTFFQEYDSINDLKNKVSSFLREWDDSAVFGLLDFVDSLKSNIKNALERIRTKNFEEALCYWNKANECSAEVVRGLFIRIKIGEESYEEVIQELQEVIKPDVKKSYSVQFVAWAWFVTGIVECQRGHEEEALKAYDTVISRFRGKGDLSLKKIVVQALHNKEVIFINSRKDAEAIETCEQLVELFKDESDCFVRQLVCLAWYNWGTILSQQKKYKEAIKIFDQVCEKFEGEKHPSIRVYLCDVLHNKAGCLGALKKFDEAIDICDQIIKESLGVSGDEQTLSFIIERSKGIFYGEKVRRAYDDKLSFLLNKASANEKESQKALDLYEKVIRGFEGVDRKDLSAIEQEIDIKAFSGKGNMLEALFESNGQEDDREKAFKAYKEAIEKFNDAKESSVVKVLAYILLQKGRMLREMGKEDVALEVLDEVITRFGDKKCPALVVWVVGAYVEKGVIFGKKCDYEKAIACNSEVIKKFVEYESFRDDVCIALQNKEYDCRQCCNWEQLIKTSKEAERIFGDSRKVKDCCLLLKLKLVEGEAHQQLEDDVVSALECCNYVINKGKSLDDSSLKELVEKAEDMIKEITQASQ